MFKLVQTPHKRKPSSQEFRDRSKALNKSQVDDMRHQNGDTKSLIELMINEIEAMKCKISRQKWYQYQ